MKYAFSVKSELELSKALHPRMVQLARLVMAWQIVDFSVHNTVRDLEEEKRHVASGASKTLKSMHLIQADGYCHAMDIYPSPFDISKINAGNAREISRFGVLAGLFLRGAQELGMLVRWGGDWDQDGETLDCGLFDAPHIEYLGEL